ncbi:hypothetical protein M902_2451 [Bacteriovorax sp. BAL6_X]|uniref:hypothetical protein n=1 Tax=Bacteriovorax sp. BAL6_X TaxID=1201290 RepID=UPI000385ECF5|nr:hypothetical protein [Bacteriovorax sp. BAL6_X]EPZ52393.1 hypothetical protein M902_2451 [Bacteriovorax sp. BAL6_X]
MIHGKSSDPVLIKRIKVNVWTLRDEVEAAVKLRYKNGEKPNIDDLIEIYKDKGELPINDSIEDEESALDPQALADAAMSGDNVTPIKETKIIKQFIPDLPAGKVYVGNILLSELYMDGMYFFCEKQFTQGQSIVVDIQIPNRIILNGVVIFSRTYNMKSRIISQTSMPFRTGIKFTFLKEGERTLLRNFIKSIEPEVREEPTAPAASKEKGSDAEDDFDLFDDLE